MSESVQHPGTTEVGPGSFDESVFEAALHNGYALIDNQPADPFAVSKELYATSDILASSIRTGRVGDTLAMLDELLSPGAAFVRGKDTRVIMTTQQKRDFAATLVLTRLAPAMMERATNEKDPVLAGRLSDMLMRAFLQEPAMAGEHTAGHLARHLNNIIAFNRTVYGPVISVHADVESDAASTIHTTNEYPELLAMGVMFPVLADSCTPEDRRELMYNLGKLAEQAPSDDYAAAAFEAFVCGEDAAEIVCSTLGLPGQKVPMAWAFGYGEGAPKGKMSSEQYWIECMRRMLSLEHKNPGICAELYRRFRIRNFGRRSEESLLRQYATRNKVFAKRVYFVEATGDDNGSATYNSMPKIEQAVANLQDQGIGATLVEVGSRRDMKVLRRIARMAGWGPVRIMFSDSHGSFNDIPLGEETVGTEDAATWLGALVAELLTEDGVHIANACDTGASPNGFAAALHRGSGREVRGSRAGTWLRSLQAGVAADGEPWLEADIRFTKKWGHTQGPPMAVYGGPATNTADTKAEHTPHTAGELASVENVCHAIAAAVHRLPFADLQTVYRDTRGAAQRLLHAASESVHDELIAAAMTADEAADRITAAIAHMTVSRRELLYYVHSVRPAAG